LNRFIAKLAFGTKVVSPLMVSPMFLVKSPRVNVSVPLVAIYSDGAVAVTSAVAKFAVTIRLLAAERVTVKLRVLVPVSPSAIETSFTDSGGRALTTWPPASVALLGARSRVVSGYAAVIWCGPTLRIAVGECAGQGF